MRIEVILITDRLQDRPYLCNMAVDPRHRGRGYGAALLQAAEQLVASLGETEIYLHVRWGAWEGEREGGGGDSRHL